VSYVEYENVKTQQRGRIHVARLQSCKAGAVNARLNIGTAVNVFATYMYTSHHTSTKSGSPRPAVQSSLSYQAQCPDFFLTEDWVSLLCSSYNALEIGHHSFVDVGPSIWSANFAWRKQDYSNMTEVHTSTRRKRLLILRGSSGKAFENRALKGERRRRKIGGWPRTWILV